MAGNDRPTPPDPHRAAKAPPPRQAPRPEPLPLDADGRVKREPGRLTGAQRAQLEQRRPTPTATTAPRTPTLHDGAPPPASMGTPQSFPPAVVEPRRQTPQSGTVAQGGDRRQPIPVVVDDTPSSRAPTRGDWAKLRYRLAAAAVAALVLIIAALGYWAVTAINAKAKAIEAAEEAKRKAETHEGEWRRWAGVVTWILDCRDRRDVQSGEMLRPDPQKMGASRKLEAWTNPCPTQLPPPP